MNIEDYSVYTCFDCGNEFLVYELPLGINDPHYCPFCGTDLPLEEDEDDDDIEDDYNDHDDYDEREY